MNGTQKTGVAAATGGLAAGIVWLANIFGLDVPSEAAAGLAALIGYIVREIRD